MTSPGAGGGGNAAAGATAPGANSPAPGVGGGTAPLVPNRPLSLSDVVNIVVGNNSGLVLARQRLQKAQELVNQVNAQNKPQLSAAANDTYASYPSFPTTLASPSISNPTLPGGGVIPTVVDQAGGLSTAFVGGGGGGNAPSTGASPALGGASTGGVGASPAVGASSPAGPSTPSVGGASPTGGGGAATPGAGAPGSLSTTAPAPGAPGAGAGTPATGGAAAPGVGGTAPGAAGGGTAPGTGAGAGAGASNAGSGGAAGMALLGLPAIIGAYVADTHTLTQPPSPAVAAPKVTVSHTEAAQAEAAQAASGEQAEPRQGGDAGGGAGGTTAGTSGTGSAVTTAGASNGLRDTYSARASVAQFIDLFGLIPAARDAQNDVRDFYALDIARLQNETALAAKNLFFNVLLAQAQVATEQEQVNYATENVRITQARLQQGVVSRFDVLTAQAALATAQQQLIAAQDQFGLAQSNISYLLGTDPDRTLALVAPPLPPLDERVDLPQSTQIALRQRPEVGQAGANIKEARELVKSAGSTLLPSVGVVGSGYYNSNGSVVTPRSYAVISAEVAIPIDDAGATRSRVRSARVDLATQGITLQQLQATVALEVRQAAINVRNAQAQVGAAQVAVAQSQEALRLAYVRYQSGVGTFLDVLNALAQLATSRTNLANAQFFYQTSLAQLVRDLGGR